jgi:tetratricopeptide (TPR) repeat protein
VFATSSYQYIQTWKNSITLWDNVISLYPDVAKPYALRGTFKGKSGDLEGSLKDFEHALALDTTYAPTYEGLGNIYGAKGQAPKALQMFEKALSLDPKNGKSYYNRAVANLQLNRLDLVLPDLDQALALAPNSTPDIQALRGFVQIQQKQYDAAIASYNQTIQLRPDANAYYYQGIAYLNNNQPEKARANFLKALQLNPKLSEAQQYLDKMGN